MIPYVGLKHGSIVLKNKKVYICFLMAFAALDILAASPMAVIEEHVAEESAAAKPAAAKHPDDVAAPVLTGRTALVVRADPRTGRLVRTVVLRGIAAPDSPSFSPTSPKSTAPSKQISDIVDQAARAHQVDPLLVHSMIKVESNYNPYAVSTKGAEGLMQLMPPTARMLGVSNSFDPHENIEAGVKYLKYLQGLYGDDRLALAAYNAGPAAVEKYKQVPPYKETQNYVEQVGRRYDDARRSTTKSTAEKTPVKVEAKVDATPDAPPVAVVIEKHPKLEQSVDEHGRLSLRTVE
jgi:hypothetical protein